MKVKNTYSRKKRDKTSGNSKTNVVNINMFFVSVNISNNHSGNQTKPETSKSESGDLFDKLVKGPIYNVDNQSSFGCSLSEYSQKFFSQRQDTATFYKSDDALSFSTDISNNLFKDSKESPAFSPLWGSPPPYCRIKNKLVKIKKQHKITISKKTYGCVQKKRPLMRKNKPLAPSSHSESASCTSSTPTRSGVVPDKDLWLDAYVSPIYPNVAKKSIRIKELHTTEERENKEKSNSVLGVTALLEGFGNLGIQTPHHKKFAVTGEEEKEQSELFCYESPMRVPVSCEMEVKTTNDSSASHSDSSQDQSGDGDGRLKVDLLVLKDRRSKSSCKLSEENLINCDSTPKGKGLKDKDFKESTPDLSSSPFLGFESNSPILSDGLDIDSRCTKAVTDPENSSSYEQSFSSSEILSPISNEEIKSKLEEGCGSMNMSLSKNTSPGEIIDKCNNNDLDCSLPIPDSKSDKPHKEEKNEESNLVIVNEEGNRSVFTIINNTKSGEESQVFESKPLSDITNLSSLVTNFENTKDISKRHVPLNQRTVHYSLRERLSGYPCNPEVNESLVKINLEAGKKWRRSLLRQKQQEQRFDRRVTLTSDTLFRLIKESSFASGVTNDTKLSYNNTTRIVDSFQEEQVTNKSISILRESPELNVTFSRLSNVFTRRRRNYNFDMNDIPEEIAEHSSDNLQHANDNLQHSNVLHKSNLDHIQRTNETETCRGDTTVEPVCESVCDTSVNRTNVFETPPILRMNPEAMSAITDRKKSRRYQQKSLERSLLWDEHDESQDEESKLYISCCSRLGLEDEIENLKNQDVEVMGKVGFLLQCGQQAPVTFSEAFPEQVQRAGQKIGEGVFGEVFMLERPGEGRSVIKIIPIEGTQMINGSVQKRYHEVLSELIITEELSLLRNNSYNCTSGFCELRNKFYLQGRYSPHLLRLWHEFDQKKRSDNECPDMFGPEQLYLALELAHAGEPVESFCFKSPQQALAVFLQTTFSLAVAESAADFEHRDLHIGNVLVQPTSDKYISFVLNGTRFECPTYESMAVIIDYTLSRISFRDDVLYLDLEEDPELFTADGDYQFDIYRDMREDLKHNWRDHQPKTNVRWLHYLMDKFTNKIKYKQKKSTKTFREWMEKMVRLREMVLDFDSATDLALQLVHFHSQTASLVRSEEER